MLLKEWICSSDYDHIQLMQQDDQLSAMPCCVVEMMVAYPC